MVARKQQLRDAQRKLRDRRRQADYVRIEIYLSGAAEQALISKSKEYGLARGEFLNMLLTSDDSHLKYTNRATDVSAHQENNILDEQGILLKEMVAKKQAQLDYWTVRYQKLCAALEQAGLTVNEE